MNLAVILIEMVAFAVLFTAIVLLAGAVNFRQGFELAFGLMVWI